MKPCLIWRASLPITLLLAIACGDDAAEDPPACIAAGLERQPTQRFVAGHTFYIPPAKEEGSCAGLRWTLAEAPAACYPRAGRVMPTEPKNQGRSRAWREPGSISPSAASDTWPPAATIT